MTDKNLSQLDIAADLNNTDLLHVRQAGIDRAVNFQLLKDKVATTTNVISVNGNVGVVVLDAADVGADPAGTAGAAVALHTAASDPHTQYALETDVTSSLAGKQDTLVSGTTIKTLNGESLLGAGDIVVSGGSGEVNTASNLGTGVGVFASKVAEDLQFKSLVAGSGVVLTPTADSIQIDATGSGGGEANTGANVGTGEGDVFRDKTGVTLNFKTIKQGSNITVTDNVDDITISAANPPVTSVFTRAGDVVAEAGDYQASDITASVSATNYTPAAATVEGHLVGIDTALASSGGGGSGGIIYFKNTGTFNQNNISATSPGTIIDLGNAAISLVSNTISGASFTAANDSITLPAGTYVLLLTLYATKSSTPVGILFRLATTSGFDISQNFGASNMGVSGTTPDPTSIGFSAHARVAFVATADTTFTINAIGNDTGVNIVNTLIGGIGNSFSLVIHKVA